MVVMVPLTTMKQDQISTMPVVAVVVLGFLDPLVLVDKVVVVLELAVVLPVHREPMVSAAVVAVAETVTTLVLKMVEMVLL